MMWIRTGTSRPWALQTSLQLSRGALRLAVRTRVRPLRDVNGRANARCRTGHGRGNRGGAHCFRRNRSVHADSRPRRLLVMAGLSLVDIETVRLIYRIDRTEAVLSVIATLGVVAVGAVNAILLVVVLALLASFRSFPGQASKSSGKVEGYPGAAFVGAPRAGEAIPGLLLVRFNAPLTFFNAPFFKRELLKLADEAGPDLRHVVLDLLPIPSVDATGLLTLLEVVEALRLRGVDFNAAGRATEWRHWAKARGFDGGRVRLFPTLRQAIRELSNDQTPP